MARELKLKKVKIGKIKELDSLEGVAIYAIKDVQLWLEDGGDTQELEFNRLRGIYKKSGFSFLPVSQDLLSGSSAALQISGLAARTFWVQLANHIWGKIKKERNSKEE